MILKLQQGGMALPPLVSYQPVTVTGGGGASVAPKDDDQQSADLTDKDLLEMLGKLDGLPSDMAVLTDALQKFYIDKSFSDYVDTSNIASRYLQFLNYMKVANFNHEVYKDALKTVSENGGINEFAISDRGQLFCMNKDGDFQLLSLEQLQENPEYQPLTNSDLLYYRAQSPQLANNNELLKVVKNGIGIQAVNTMIQATLDKLGSTQVVKEGYSGRKGQQILSGAQLLQEAVVKGALDEGLTSMSVDGLYKNRLLTKEQTSQAKAALNYIYNTLPQNAKTLLQIKAGEEGVEKLLIQLVSSQMDNTIEFQTDLQKESGSSSSGSGGTTDKSKINPAVAFQQDLGTEVLLPVNAGTSDSLLLQAYLMPVNTKEGSPIGVTTLDKVSNDSALSGIFDFSQVTMGGETLEMGSAQNIVVDGTSIYKAYLPIDVEKAGKGIIAPNLDYLGQLEAIRTKIKETNATTPDQINAIYAEYNMPKFLMPDGSVNQEYYKPFGLMNATALSDAFKKGSTALSNPNLSEITDENDIQNYWNILKGKDSKEKFDSYSWLWNAGGFWGSWQQMLKGIVYLPLKSIDPTLGMYSGGDTPSESQLRANRQAMQTEQRLSTYKPMGQL